MATVLLCYLNHTDPRAGGAVHGYHLVEQLRRHGYDLITAERRSDGRLRRFPRTVLGMRAVLAAADCIYMRCNTRPWDTAMLALNARTRQIPLVIEVNEPPDEEPAYGSPWRFPMGHQIRSAVRGLHYRGIARAASAVVCVSRELSDMVRVTFPVDAGCVFIVPNGGAPVTELPAPRGDGEFRVVWAGGARWPWQALDTIVDAAAILHRRNPNVWVHLYTDEPNRFRNAAGVRARSLVPHNEFRDVLLTMDAAICLRRGGTYCSPLKLFDCMAAGLPVVASNVGQIAEVVEEGTSGFLVGDDPGDVARPLIELSQDPRRCRSMGEAARDRIARDFSWDHTGDRIDCVIRSVL